MMVGKEGYIETRFGIVMEQITDALVGINENLETISQTLKEMQKDIKEISKGSFK